MSLPPCQWIAHVQATKKDELGNTKSTHTIELVVTAVTMHEAQVAANAKVVEFGYQPWAVNCSVLPRSRSEAGTAIVPVGQQHPLFNPPPVVEKSNTEKLFENPAFFHSSITKPKYGGGITSASSPL